MIKSWWLMVVVFNSLEVSGSAPRLHVLCSVINGWLTLVFAEKNLQIEGLG